MIRTNPKKVSCGMIFISDDKTQFLAGYQYDKWIQQCGRKVRTPCYVNLGGKREVGESIQECMIREFLEELLFNRPVPIDPQFIQDMALLFLEGKTVYRTENEVSIWYYVICSYTDLNDLLTFIRDMRQFIVPMEWTHLYTYSTIPKNVQELLTRPRRYKMKDGNVGEISHLRQFPIADVIQRKVQRSSGQNGRGGWDPHSNILDRHLIDDITYIYRMLQSGVNIFQITIYHKLKEGKLYNLI